MDLITHRPSTEVATLTRRWAALWLLAVPALAVAVLLRLGQPAEPFTAEVVASTSSQTDQGLVGDVSWVDEDGIRRVRTFNLTEQQVSSGTVLLLNSENQVRVFDPSRESGPSGLIIAATAAVAFLFAVVVLATVRGFGFVRGTGQPGEMTPDEVEESHAFYWRH